MTDIIERVAKAILAEHTESMFDIFHARVYARAAIAAMREPTGAMYMAGGIVAPSAHLADKDYKPYGTRTIGDMAAKAAWEKMIDAALEENK
jgi:hypothetical protein